MSVDPNQMKVNQAAQRGAQGSAAPSQPTNGNEARPSALPNLNEQTAASALAPEGVQAQRTSQSVTELSDIANEVRRIRTIQQRETEQVQKASPVATQKRSNRPGDASVIVGASQNDALPVSDRAGGTKELTVSQLENKLAAEPERVPADFGATIREMQRIRRQPLSSYEPAPSDSRRLGKAVRIEMDTRRKVEINELIEKRGNDFGGGLVNMNPTIAYQEIMKSSSDQTASQTEDSEYQRRLPDGAVDSKPGTANAGTKVSGSLERYAAAAQFTEKTQSDVGSKSLEEIKEALRSRGAFDKVRGSK